VYRVMSCATTVDDFGRRDHLPPASFARSPAFAQDALRRKLTRSPMLPKDADEKTETIERCALTPRRVGGLNWPIANARGNSGSGLFGRSIGTIRDRP
jgi:hypothetical protein